MLPGNSKPAKYVTRNSHTYLGDFYMWAGNQMGWSAMLVSIECFGNGINSVDVQNPAHSWPAFFDVFCSGATSLHVTKSTCLNFVHALTSHKPASSLKTQSFINCGEFENLYLRNNPNLTHLSLEELVTKIARSTPIHKGREVCTLENLYFVSVNTTSNTLWFTKPLPALHSQTLNSILAAKPFHFLAFVSSQ